MTAVDDLIVALESCADDGQRLDLLADLTADEQQRLQATLTYRQWIRDCERELAAEQQRFAEFSDSLARAADDVARRAIIAAADSEFLAAWYRDRTETAREVWLRYNALLRA